MAQIRIPTNPNPKADDTGFDNFSPKRGRPMLFQIADPLYQRPLYPVLLALHVNPQSLSEKMQKSKNVVMTYGGFVEFIWPDDLDSLSADQTSGAFISPRTGLTAGSQLDSINQGRQGTIAWERQEDLLELFRMNGAVYNGVGQPVLRGRVLCIFDRGIYAGHFTNFTVNESDDKAFTFQLTWEFKVEQTIYRFPTNAQLDLSDSPGVTSSIGGSGNLSEFVSPPARGTVRDFSTGIDNGQFDSTGIGDQSPLPKPVDPSSVIDNTATSAGDTNLFSGGGGSSSGTTDFDANDRIVGAG